MSEKTENGEGAATATLEKQPAAPRWRPTAVPLAVLGAVLTCTLAYVWGAKRASEPGAVSSLAVLPIRNLSGEPQDDYLTDGIAEALVTQLARIRDLKVVSFSRSRRFKDASQDATEIGKRLGVDAILEGALRKNSGRLLVSLHLVQAGTGFELWGDNTFEIESHSLLETQRQLSDAIAVRLRRGLIPAERARIATAGTTSGEAYELFLRGRQLTTRSAPLDYVGGTSSQREIGCEMLKRAVELDPNFTAAFAWLSRAFLQLGKVDEASAAANRAILLDANSPAALMALVFINRRMGRTRDALLLARRAFDAVPDDLDALGAAAEAYFRAGMLDRAIPLYREALHADPSNLDFRSQLARSHLYAGEYQKGIALLSPDLQAGDIGTWAMMLNYELGQFSKAMEVAELSTRNRPGDSVGWYFAGCIFAAAGQQARAREIWRKGISDIEDRRASRGAVGGDMFVGFMYAKLGMREKALEQARRQLALNPRHPQELYFASKLHAILGDRREALDFLREAIANGFLTIGWLDYHRRPHMGLHNLDKDPEFQAIHDDLLRKIEELRRIS